MVLVSNGYCGVGEVVGRVVTWPSGDTARMGLLGWGDGRKLCEDVILAQFKPLVLFFFRPDIEVPEAEACQRLLSNITQPQK